MADQLGRGRARNFGQRASVPVPGAGQPQPPSGPPPPPSVAPSRPSAPSVPFGAESAIPGFSASGSAGPDRGPPASGPSSYSAFDPHTAGPSGDSLRSDFERLSLRQSSAQNQEPPQVSGFSHRGTNRPVVRAGTLIGNQDKQVNLLANYVRVKNNKRLLIYQYHVDFSIKVVNPDTRVFLIQQEAELFNNAYIYDKQNTIMSTTCLHIDPYTYTHNLNDRKQAKVSIRKVRVISIDDEQMMHFFNAQLRLNMEKMSLVQILKYFYNFDHRVSVAEHKLEIIPGIVATIKNTQDGILMGLDTIHKVIHLKTCLDVINEMAEQGKTYFEKELVGSIVLTRYNNRTYRICGLDRNKTPLEEFDKKGGDKTNFIEYYQQNYNITISHERQPLLIAVSSNFEKKQKSKKLLLVPELCYITGLTPSMQTNFQLKRLMIQRTQLTPHDRVNRYQAFLQVINNNPQVLEELEKWQIGYGQELLKITGTLLAPERIITQDQIGFNQASADFTRELRGKPMYRSCSLTNWHIVFYTRDEGVSNDFAREAQNLCRNFGIGYAPPEMIASFSDNSRGFLQAMSKIVRSDLVMVVLPNNNKTMYDDIKKHLCCEVGFPSQCVLSRTLFKKNVSITTKIVIQMAVKVGAEPWVLESPPEHQDMMIVGFDVFRDKSKRKKSVGGFVASLNSTFSSWFSKINFHAKTEETSDQFATSLSAALRAYHKRNNRYPSKVLVIRDGVSEGQYKFTIENELEQLKQRAYQMDPNCKITLMCLNKRIMTRYFSIDEILANPISGTVVDHTICNPNIPQFFLVSQATTQGTVSPTSYDILQDNIGWQLVDFQRLIYKLCHLYYNWTGLISVPAPCQYAHKLAYLAGGSFEKPFMENLSEKLFYL